MLCSKCQEKIQRGAVNDIYMNVAKFLLDIESKYPLIQKSRLNKVVDNGGYLVLVVGRGDRNKIMSYGGKFTREVGDEFRKRVIVLESGVNDRRFLEDLFANQHIITINIIWLPDGTTETRVVLRGRRSRRLSKKRLRALSEIAKKVRNMNLRIEYA
jgi:transcription antitermination factor NusA-like protein